MGLWDLSPKFKSSHSLLRGPLPLSLYPHNAYMAYSQKCLYLHISVIGGKIFSGEIAQNTHNSQQTTDRHFFYSIKSEKWKERRIRSSSTFKNSQNIICLVEILLKGWLQLSWPWSQTTQFNFFDSLILAWSSPR